MKKAPDCSPSNASCASWKHARKRWHEKLTLPQLCEGCARALVELEDAVVLLNEAIGREERDAMAREHTTTLEQEVERAERHMRVVGQDSARVDEERLEVENRRAQALLEAEAAETAREAAADNVIKASALLTSEGKRRSRASRSQDNVRLPLLPRSVAAPPPLSCVALKVNWPTSLRASRDIEWISPRWPAAVKS